MFKMLYNFSAKVYIFLQSSKYFDFFYQIPNKFCTFGFAELTLHSEMKRKTVFLLHFSHFFVTLHSNQCVTND